MQTEISELDFLIRAANYGGSDFSPAAREAVDLYSQKLAAVARVQLDVTRERLKGADAAEFAKRADAQRLPI